MVSTTRNNGVVGDNPIRIEVLGSEEINEETAIRPGNISELLSEASGLQVQQTSAVTGNVSFRLQGLPGTYTQLLKDGFPGFTGFSSGLSLLQIPPLDLQQVEIIKGSISTLYGEGAIGGIINLVSRTPAEKPLWTIILNRTHKKGSDISSFYSKRNGKIGVTFLASQSAQVAYDVDNDGFTDLPDFRQMTLNPRLFYYFDDSTTLSMSLSSFFENREGGDISTIKKGVGSSRTFVENSKSNRFSTRLKFTKKFTNNGVLTLKNSVNYFLRKVNQADFNFIGRQIFSFSEASYLWHQNNHRIVFGLNFVTDSFQQKHRDAIKLHDYDYYTPGVFAQDDWQITPRLTIQPGIRFDYHSEYKSFLLPHLSSMYKFTDNFFVRLNGGYGYNIPGLFDSVTDFEERYLFRYKGALNWKAETSKEINFDVTYNFYLDEFIVSINQALFLTKVDHALIIQSQIATEGNLNRLNSNTSLFSKGFDTNIVMALEAFSLFIDYSYTDVQQTIDNVTSNFELTPSNKFNMTLAYEANPWRSGIEAFYTGRQYLSRTIKSRDFWTLGFMIERSFENFSLIFNIENIFDERQTKYGPVVRLSNRYPEAPAFEKIYAPLDGVVANVALMVRVK